MKPISLSALFFALLLFTACEGPSLSGGKVKREYFTNGQLRSEFVMSDSTGQNGIKKMYGPDGKLTSTVPIQNGVKHGVEKLYDEDGRVLKTTPYVMGRKDGEEKGYFPNGSVWFILPYRKGVLNGNAYMYRQDGSVVRKGVYRNGRLIN